MPVKSSHDKTRTPTSSPSESESPSRRLFSWPVALVALTLGLLLAASSVSAWGRRDHTDVGDFKEHAEFFVGRMLKKLDTTDEQRTRIQTIIAGSIDELAASHGDREGLHEELSDLMTAETIDREAIEALRAEHLARADEMSRIVSARLADVMDELTVEQRTELQQRIERKRGRHGWH